MNLEKMQNQKVNWIFAVVLSIVGIFIVFNTVTGDWGMTYAEVDKMMQTVDLWINSSYRWDV